MMSVDHMQLGLTQDMAVTALVDELDTLDGIVLRHSMDDLKQQYTIINKWHNKI